jgi:hypothetical protein
MITYTLTLSRQDIEIICEALAYAEDNELIAYDIAGELYDKIEAQREVQATSERADRL